MPFNSRQLLGTAGVAGVAAVGGAGVDRGLGAHPVVKEEPMNDDATRFGDPRIPAELGTGQSHLFRLGASPVKSIDGGSLQRDLGGQLPDPQGSTGQRGNGQHGTRRDSRTALASQRLGDQRRHRRCRHLDPARSGTQRQEVRRAPRRPGLRTPGLAALLREQGRRGPPRRDRLQRLCSRGKADIGIGASITKLPAHVLGAVFGVDPQTFSSFKKVDGSLTIIRAR